MINLELTEQEAKQLIDSIESGKAIYKWQSHCYRKWGHQMVGSEDKAFIRRFRVRVVNRIKKEIERQLKQ